VNVVADRAGRDAERRRAGGCGCGCGCGQFPQVSAGGEFFGIDECDVCGDLAAITGSHLIRRRSTGPPWRGSKERGGMRVLRAGFQDHMDSVSASRTAMNA
jgi:hypothetical protein